MATVRIDGAAYAALPGERLSELLIRVGRAIPMPCGGRGTCGKCRVRVDGNETLACGYVVRTDIEVGLPAAEVHLSDVTKREAFRQISYAGMACQKHYIGMGIEGYLRALEEMVKPWA